ncbi:MAG: hypothetical protein MJ195_00335 [Mycoplasmoidaceae bacterium]|nr:hypothetical protein [Mycoplasmoidaceae bacterium]
MMKMSKKTIGIIAGSSAALIAATTITTNVLIKNENREKDNKNPLNRDKSYHYYSLVNKISQNEKINNLISMIRTESGITYIIEEKKFVDNIKAIVQEALKSISTFARTYLNYTIDVHYKINTKSILVDLV